MSLYVLLVNCRLFRWTLPRRAGIVCPCQRRWQYAKYHRGTILRQYHTVRSGHRQRWHILACRNLKITVAHPRKAGSCFLRGPANPCPPFGEGGRARRGRERFPAVFLALFRKWAPKNLFRQPFGLPKKAPAQTGKGTAKIRRLCYTVPDRKGRGKCAWRGMR